MNTVEEESGGLIVAAYGKSGTLETNSGEVRRFVLKGRRLRVVCGDRVSYELQPDDEPVLVTGLGDRKNLLARCDPRGRPEVLAANIDQLIVVVAATPEPDFFVVDRFLCAAEILGCAGSIVANKNDIDADPGTELDEYRNIGYEVLSVSAHTKHNLPLLLERLRDCIAVMVGQSGVGKSSLINALIPDATVRVGELSARSEEGRHTTTASVMHRLGNDARLIDSPGVREFVPYIESPESVQCGFREILALAGECRFNNCRHLREPDCAVLAACAGGGVTPRRYESYKRLYRAVKNERG